jgi:transcriptional regulator with XRE-family HTH domain
METFGQRLTNLRKQHNMTQNDIAQKLNISYQAVSKWENDITSPDIDSLIALADIFEISVDELLGRKQEEKVNVESKDFNHLICTIEIGDEDDTMKFNLPLSIVENLVSSKQKNIINGNKQLKQIDFEHIIELARLGVLGEIVNITSSDGDRIIVNIH